MGIFHRWRSSMGQLIYHSIELRSMYEECVQSTIDDSAVSTAFRHLRAAKHRIETYMTPLSRSVLNITALLAFATKLGMVRRGKPEGDAADVFLTIMNAQIILLAGMMADAGQEVLSLVRLFDTEGLSTTSMCRALGDFMNRIQWLFVQQGCFEVNGHTKFVSTWLLSPHFVSVRGEGKCIGGIDVMASTFSDNRQEALSHMQAWVTLAKHTLEAEFPSFDLIQAFSAFDLPAGPCKRLVMTQALDQKLRRLSSTFQVNDFRTQFLDHWSFAHSAYEDAGYTCSCWHAWTMALRARSRPTELPTALLHVIQRGLCFLPVTSGIEQSFSRVAGILGSNRLCGTPASEQQTVRLLVTHMSPGELKRVASASQDLWSRAFPDRLTRCHKRRRCDRGISKIGHTGDAPDLSEKKPTERQFLKRFRAEVGAKLTVAQKREVPSSAEHIWTERHEKEMSFQEKKLASRRVQASA